MKNRVVWKVANKVCIATPKIRTGPPDVTIMYQGNGRMMMSVRGRIGEAINMLARDRGITLEGALHEGLHHIEETLLARLA